MTENQIVQPVVDTNSIADFLGGTHTYMVPSYQRNYAWEDEHVNQLLEDLDVFVTSGFESYYILGQVILAPNTASTSHNTWALVDGQQRLTTIYLLMIALREQFLAFSISESDSGEAANSYRQVIAALFFQRREGSRQQRFEATKDAKKAIDSILADEALPAISANDSADRVRENFQAISSWIRNNLTDAEKLSNYTRMVLNRVFLIRAELDSEEQALDIFEKINNRGKALNSAELFKNLLFSKVSRDNYEVLDESWNKAGKEVYKVDFHRAASMEYLMQALLAQRTGTFVSSKNVYKEWRDLLPRDTAEITQFAKNLVDSAKKLALVGSTASPSNIHTAELSAPKYFGVVQHLPVALSASRFPETSPLYAQLTRFLDARVALFMIAEEKANSANADMWKFSKKIAELGDSASFQEFLESLEFGRQEARRLLDAAAPRIRNLRYDNTRDRKRIRYVLALAANFAEGQSQENADANALNALLSARTKVRFDLDHIQAQSSVDLPGFDSSNGKDWVNSIGNLALLHTTDNKQAGATSAESKSIHYASSKLALTRALAIEADQSGNARLGTGIDYLRRSGAQTVENWGFEKVQLQADFYVKCFEEAILDRLGF